MAEDRDWQKWYEESYAHAQKELDERARKSLLDGTYFNAGAYAKRAAKNDGFYPRPGKNGEPIFTVQQGLMAACHAREDVTAIAVIQRIVLRGITALVFIGLACLGVLLYVATHIRY